MNSRPNSVDVWVDIVKERREKMKIAVVFGWFPDSCPVTVIVYPERLQPFVRDMLYSWEREEEERNDEISFRDGLSSDLATPEHDYWEGDIKKFDTKRSLKPQITRKLLEKATGEERMTRVLLTLKPFHDTDFLAGIIWQAFNVYWVEVTKRSQETLEFFPITSEKHLERERR